VQAARSITQCINALEADCNHQRYKQISKVSSRTHGHRCHAAGGRYLSDVWQLNLETLTWSVVTDTYEVAEHPDDPVPARFPASAAAVALPHRGRVLLIGGHVKRKDPKAPLAVRVLDPARTSWSVLHCDGNVSRTRGSHVACIIGDRVFVLGGESPKRQLQAGIQVLDLQTNTWSELHPEGDSAGPPPASGMVMSAYQRRYLMVFGGGAVGHCNNTTWCFDTATNTWQQPPISGSLPAPRAGCCGALLGHRWYVFGGGNNTAGCPDMWVLNLHKLGLDSLSWEKVCTFDTRSSLASEGASVVAVPAVAALVSFGGYNGSYHNAVSVFKPAAAAYSDSSTLASNGWVTRYVPTALRVAYLPASRCKTGPLR
jgi:Galactose oxidase, central domain